MRVVVVGAGIVGSATALRLAQRGAEVTVVDARLPGDGTTGTSFAWVGASHEGLADYFELNVQGMAAHRRLAAELGEAPWLHLHGSLKWEPGREEWLAQRVEELRGAGYGAVLLSRREAEALEPDLVLPPGLEQVALYADEGWVDGRVLVAHLLRAADVELRTGDAVVELAPRGVVLASGTRLHADAVVLCCGRWTGEVAALAGADLPMVSPEPPGSIAVGLLALTSAVTTTLRRVVITGPGLDLRPGGAGRLLLHSEELDREGTTELAGELLARARALVRPAGSATIEHARLGFRSLPADTLPAIGWLRDGLYAAATHSGMTIGLHVGELVAAEVAGGHEEPSLARFRPARLRGLEGVMVAPTAMR